jgi:hypothetical protein
MYVLTATVALMSLLAGSAPCAYARHSKPPKMHYKIKKNAGPFGGNYMKPKKQKKPSGYYQNSVTGQVVYGTPKRQPNPISSHQ